MPISVTCDCGKSLKIPDAMAGKRVRCPGCKNALKVPGAIAANGAPPARSAAPSHRARTGRDDSTEGPPPVGRKGGKALLLILGVLAVVALFGCLLAAGGGFALYQFVLKSSDSGTDLASASGSRSGPPVGSPDKEQTRLGLDQHEKYLPAKSVMVESSRRDRLRSSPLYNELTSGSTRPSIVQNLAKNFDVLEDEIERLTVGVVDTSKTVTIFSTKKAVNIEETARRLNLKESKAGNHKMYGMPGTFNAMAVPEKGICIQGTTTEVRAILQRDHKPELSTSMKKALDLADFSKSIVVLADPSFLKGSLPLVALAEAFVAEADVTDGYTETSVILYHDAKTAEDMRPQVENNARQEHEKSGDGQYAVSVSGAQVIVKESLTADEARKNKSKLLEKLRPGG